MNNYFDEIDLATAESIDLHIRLLMAANPTREQWQEMRAEMRRFWLNEVHLAATGNLPAQIRADAWFDLARWARHESIDEGLAQQLRSKLAKEFPAFAALEVKRKQPEYGEDEARAFAMLSYGEKYELHRQ